MKRLVRWIPTVLLLIIAVLGGMVAIAQAIPTYQTLVYMTGPAALGSVNITGYLNMNGSSNQTFTMSNNDTAVIPTVNVTQMFLSGTVWMSGLPTADPHSVGELWIDPTGHIVASAG